MKDMGGKSHVVTLSRLTGGGHGAILIPRGVAAKDATDFAGFGGCLKTQSLEIGRLALGSAIQLLKQSHDISRTGNGR